MDRWKILAISSLSFSLGMAYTMACGGEGKGDTGFVTTASATTGTGSVAARVAELEAERGRWECFLDHMTDHWGHGNGQVYVFDSDYFPPGGQPWHQGPNSDAEYAYKHCWEGGPAAGG